MNKSYCEAIGDFSQVDWESAPQWQRDSALAGIKFHIENPNSKPSNSHESWYAQKEREGWKYGPVKDADKKEHPCMVPFEELAEKQKAKDFLFLGVTRAMEGYLL